MSDLDTMLQDPLTTLALCWKLTRGDGVALGFTSHDRDLSIGGLLYKARPGMTPSAVSQTADMAVDSMEASGPLTNAGLSAGDFEAGRWAGAKVELFGCDWTDPENSKKRLMKGSLGSVVRNGFGLSSSFRAELLSELSELEQIQPLRLSPLCRAELGDGRCGVNMRGRRIELKAAGWSGNELQLLTSIAEPDLYSFGRMRWISGPLTGVDRRVIKAESDKLILEDALPELMSEPGLIWLWEGCDKRFATCVQRFNNAAAFDGEPHVPGSDALQRYGSD